MNTPRPIKLCAIIAICGLSVVFADEGKDESGKGKAQIHRYSKEPRHKEEKPRHFEEQRRKEDRGSYFYEHGYARLHIPPGHYPPPGECRIWYPDRPPGHQPPPGKCDRVPPGAWLIRHPHDHPGYVHVTVYEPQRPSVVLVVGEFEIASGAFVRVVLSR
jgi:hypothetical protein